MGEATHVPTWGRGPKGRLRNFKAMSDSTLISAYRGLALDDNDQVAFNAAMAEATRRGLSVDGLSGRYMSRSSIVKAWLARDNQRRDPLGAALDRIIGG